MTEATFERHSGKLKNLPTEIPVWPKASTILGVSCTTKPSIQNLNLFIKRQ